MNDLDFVKFSIFVEELSNKHKWCIFHNFSDVLRKAVIKRDK